MGNKYFAVHGHFYQPLRLNPFTGEIPREIGAEPYHDFNEKIDAECYRPNAVNGNFSHISFNIGPTLADWLQEHDRHTYDLIVASDRDHRDRFGIGNAIAQAYNHTILPLATTREKRIQIGWGIADFTHRFGRRPEGLWLAETAVDYETLGIMADFSLQFTVLAPWQAAEPVDPSEPYWVKLRNGKRIAVFFYNQALSGAVSFDADATVSADMFAAEDLARHVDQQRQAADEPQLILVATDGEVYGHHKPWRDQFLRHLLSSGAPCQGFETVALTRYLQMHPPRREILIEEDTSWSCHHGIRRWKDSCDCTEGSGTWKWHLRRAFGRLAARIDTVYEIQTNKVLRDPWGALEDYVDVKLGTVSAREFLRRHQADSHPFATLRASSMLARARGRECEAARVLKMLESQYYRQLMFTSCAFFFEDLDRIEPRNNIAMSARAIQLIREAGVIDLEASYIDNLAACKSWRTGRTAADIYREVAPRGKAYVRRQGRAAAQRPHRSAA